MFNARKVLEPAFQEQPRSFFWKGITDNYAVDEAEYLNELIPLAQSDAAEHRDVTDTATQLIQKVREQDDSVHMVDALLQEYSLDTEEGILLMCLAEALMRIPDKYTADALIEDKMSVADWQKHVGRSDSTLVNASTWGLLLTGHVVKMDRRLDGSPANIWKRLVKRSGEPVIRSAMYRAMGIMGKQFVLGRDIDEALKNAREYREKGYTYSFDMLGEAAMTREDANRYLQDYLNAIESVGNNRYPSGNVPAPSISIKLSALHPRFEAGKEVQLAAELVPKLLSMGELQKVLHALLRERVSIRNMEVVLEVLQPEVVAVPAVVVVPVTAEAEVEMAVLVILEQPVMPEPRLPVTPVNQQRNRFLKAPPSRIRAQIPLPQLPLRAMMIPAPR